MKIKFIGVKVEIGGALQVTVGIQKYINWAEPQVGVRRKKKLASLWALSVLKP